ncbi:N-acetylmuramoyl-L-alanine amidase family protein [Azospirillum canadense]|uniref:N-acetylmuramoyl-L-alanine amidase family protein n=1 Tax=Azospirillum canadense TaxID=403962 RepID=UPI0022278300|nr:N-acetylmuramoyl-L-alanine amidase [Azospirillum canadense]MCW2243511.1 N-acetylmuramoyl-L-alanine amidase [Azospirillum canadense]
MDRRRFLQLSLTVPLAGAAGLVPSPLLATGAKATARPAPRTRMIVLDPGHGGVDPGAIGTRGTQEKEVTLDIAREVARLLSGQHRLGATLTRSDDRFLELQERVDLAREARADLFVSIHADSAPNREARGLSAYTLSEKGSDAFAASLAQRENAVDRLGGVDFKAQKRVVKDILLDLTARHTKHASLVARQSIVKGAGKELRLLDNPMRAANFAVLKAPEIPSVLIETGFLSNKLDEAILRDSKARRTVARVLAREIASLVTRTPFA